MSWVCAGKGLFCACFGLCVQAKQDEAVCGVLRLSSTLTASHQLPSDASVLSVMIKGLRYASNASV